MFPTIADTQKVKFAATPGMGLSNEDLQLWQRMDTTIEEWWQWFTGEKLKLQSRSKPGKDGQYPLIYPLQINPIRTACELHSFALTGQIKDTGDPPVRSIAKGNQKATDFIDLVEYENRASAMFIDMFLSSQSLGASVVKVGWDPIWAAAGKVGVRWEYINPRYFFCRWRGTDYWDITEAWVRLNITKNTAQQYGIESRDEVVTYVEHWLPDRFEVKIADKVAYSADGEPLSKENPFGFVPFVYVPHTRSGDFWGTSLVPAAIGLTKEINARAADIGDAVQKGVHRKIWMANVKNGFPSEKEFPDGGKYYDLGKTNSASDPQPTMQEITPPDVPAGYHSFLEDLSQTARIGMLTPDIAYGLEEGSQRSGQTLNHRMWPMLSAVIAQRVNWTTAMNLICDFSLKIAAKHKRGGIEDADTKVRWRHDWAPMVPLDRAALVQELIQRWQEETISLETLVEKFGDIPEIQDEIAKIKKLQEENQQKQLSIKAGPPNTAKEANTQQRVS